MDTPGVQQQSAQSDYSINNNEHNEVNHNASDTDDDLSFIKKLGTREGHKKLWILPQLHSPVTIIFCILRF